MRIRVMGVAAFALVVACGMGPTQVEDGDGGVLFVGNSLTYANELPEMVRALALASGKTLRIGVVANPDWSLEDHWSSGDARGEIQRGGWEVVVLQQGPSSLAESRALLIDYARRFAGEIRAAGAVPALYAVWPSRARFGDFDRASESYRLAAQDVNGLYLPVAAAWLIASEQAPDVKIYQIDGIHPTVEGSYLAAAVIYARLTGRRATGLPGTVTPRFGLRITLHPDVALALQRAADRAIAECCSVP